MKKKCLAIGIIILLFGMCVIPTNAKNIEKSQSILKGNWLYVGGSGPGNYTKIQDAVDNASDGDTVFVFDDSSPYVENIVVNTSLSLIGEKKETTIINGSTNGSNPYRNLSVGIIVLTENVLVKGFTIQDCNGTGIGLLSKNNSIMENIFSDNEFGVTTGSGNTISSNLFIRNNVGIYIANESNNIFGNMIFHNGVGVGVVLSKNDNISNNIISENGYGVYISGSYNTMLYRNNISYNNEGVYTWLTSADKILQNNFIGNNKSANSIQNILMKIQLFKKELNLPLHRNVWSENYWDDWDGTGPYVIYTKTIFIRHFSFDWHPAKEPYNITGMT
jgi:parallel beta-helix repeat protein